jgi:hypothetical protein
MNQNIVFLATAAVASAFAAVVMAKLPPQSDEAKAKAAQKSAKAAHESKIADYQLCRSMDKVAADYHAANRKAGKATNASVQTASCADPGKYAPPKPPLEAAGAHSPPKTASSPPNEKAPQTPRK